MNKKILIIFSIIFLGLSFAIYQYATELKTDLASAAYTTSKPANGHSWSEMECPEGGLCIRGEGTNQKVGIGLEPISTSKKFEVNGDIKTSGDICNGTGNCLSALATLTNACGGAATNYAYNATAFSGTYCVMGTPTPASPAFPGVGTSTTWTCPVTSGSPISCTANRAATPVNGVCGPAATSYAYTATSYAGAYCTTGETTASPAFPGQGSSSSWSCLGINGGSSPACVASRGSVPPPAFLVNSLHSEAACTAAGGSVVATTTSANQCRFNATACPSGWISYGWTTTQAYFCYVQGNNGGTYMTYHDWSATEGYESVHVWKCTNSAHSFSGDCNNRYPCTIDCSTGTYGDNTCSSTRTQIGCY